MENRGVVNACRGLQGRVGRKLKNLGFCKSHDVIDLGIIDDVRV